MNYLIALLMVLQVTFSPVAFTFNPPVAGSVNNRVTIDLGSQTVQSVSATAGWTCQILTRVVCTNNSALSNAFTITLQASGSCGIIARYRSQANGVTTEQVKSVNCVYVPIAGK